MVFSKFRALDICNAKYIYDILRNKRLYAPTFEQLNDVGEFAYRYSYRTNSNESATDSDRSERVRVLRAIYDEKNLYRVCSFSERYRDEPYDDRQDIMWAHYANGSKGIRIDFTLDESIKTPKVDYDNNTLDENTETHEVCDDNMEPFSWESLLNIASSQSAFKEHFTKIMIRKNPSWRYEREHRVLYKHNENRWSEESQYIPINIKNIVIGRGFLQWGFEYRNGRLSGEGVDDILAIARHIKDLLGGSDIPIQIYTSKYSNELVNDIRRYL